MTSVKKLKKTSILAVAQALGMTLKRVGSDNYQWIEHPSLNINTTKNIFSWFKYDTHGDVFELIQTIREKQTGVRPTFKEAKRFLETGRFDQIELVEQEKKPFVYSLSNREVADMTKAKDYLMRERGLSEETIRFFQSQGVLAEATYGYQGASEPVVVFKARDRQGKVVGASLQGIVPNWTKHERGRLKRLMKDSDGYYGMSVTIGNPQRLVFAEAPIDLMSYYELHKHTLSDVRLVAMDGLKEGTISHYYMALQAELAGQEYTFDRTKTPRALARVAKITTTFHNDQNKEVITLAVDNDEGGRNFIRKLTSKGIGLTQALPPLNKGGRKMDWNDYLQQKKASQFEEDTKKALGQSSQELLNDRTSDGTGFLQPEAEGSATPASDDAFERSVTSRPTSSYPYLHFSTDYGKVQRKLFNYYPVKPRDIKRLNQYAASIQSVARWYIDELADSKILYVYQDGEVKGLLQVEFERGNFTHLAGIRPFEKGKHAADFIVDFAEGRGHYSSMLVSDSLKTKLQVLPLLPDILEANSFVLDDISSVPKLHQLDMSKAIKSSDEDFLLLFRDIGELQVPASLMKLKGDLLTNIKKTNQKVILGIYRERDDNIEQLSINEAFIKDGGKAMFDEVEKRAQENGETLVFKEEMTSISALQPEMNTENKPSEQVMEMLANKDTKALAAHMKEGVKEYLNSKQYKTFLTTMAKFPRYSSRNIQLILAQKPNATYVTSFKQWKETFERSVKQGEKAMRIWAPMTVKQRDPKTGKVLLDEKGNEKTALRFKLVPVFDVSQTDGKDIPKAIHELEGTHKDYANLYRAAKSYAESKGVNVIIDKTFKGAKGYYAAKDQTIVIKGGMSEQHTLKTLFHELAHSDLHASKEQTAKLKYSHAELQAESVAYVVANHYGFNTSEYSFGYLGSWVDDKQALSDLEAQLDIVQKEAKALIISMDTFLEAQLTKATKMNSLESRLEGLAQETTVTQTDTKEEKQDAKKDQAEVQERT
ncbi:PBECR4 domain-containing protein [Streptococcus canis]|uniref:PBECR4 domain-containing protein n=1 Tax=Streptococcus canis TaxID=1329 RepID=UPI0040358362